MKFLKVRKYLLGGLLLSMIQLATAQSYSFTSQSAQDGLFGFYGGYVLSHLNQPLSDNFPDGKRAYHQGWEAGIKAEMWRGLYVRGNATISYQQTGATEWYQNEADADPMEINLQSVKLSINPLIFKTPGDFFHVYGGGGFYGSYIFNQEILNPHQDFILDSEGNVDNKDLGVNLLGGVNFWNLEVEVQVGFGMLGIAERIDESKAQQRFASVTLAYMFDRVKTEVKSCKDKRRLTRMTKRK